MYSIERNLMPNLPQTPYRNGVGQYEGVVLHATANNGDTADGERNYEVTHWQNAFVHFFCDYSKVLQVADTQFVAWGAGGIANKRYVHIELCQTVNDDTPEARKKFDAAYKNWIWVAAYLLYQRKLGVTPATLWSHHRVTKELGGTTHCDPDDYLATWGKSWENVQNDVLYMYNAYANPAPPPLPEKASELVEALSVTDLSKENADKILDILHEAWKYASPDGRIDLHIVANKVRKLSGQKEVK
jgi:N-acetylmuramoyl-L-alanine amidase CwlA